MSSFTAEIGQDQNSAKSRERHRDVHLNSDSTKEAGQDIDLHLRVSRKDAPFPTVTILILRQRRENLSEMCERPPVAFSVLRGPTFKNMGAINRFART